MSHLDPFKSQLAQAVHKAVSTIAPDMKFEDVLDAIEYPADTTHGDYALPCFKFSRVLRKAPPAIAAEIKDLLEKDAPECIDTINPIGGFLNIKIKSTALAETALSSILDGSFFDATKFNAETKKECVMVEFSQPNTHKEFHVGHGRNVVLGDCLCRLYGYLGHDIIPVNYIGDEGTHIAKCLSVVKDHMDEMPETNRAEWLGQKYVESNLRLEEAEGVEKEKLQKEISGILADIEKKQDPTYSLWKETRQYCLDDFNKIYEWLDVHFKHFYYESEVSEDAQEAVEHYMKEGLFHESQGAIGIDMSDDKLGFMMVRKTDGNTLYITKDIALARKKFDQYPIDRNIYVVGSEQELHFKQLFHFMKMAKFPNAEKCYHLSYGMVRRADGKMSSRTGNSFTFLALVGLIQDKLAEYLEKYQGEWLEEKLKDVADKLTVGAIKYGMLYSDPRKDIVFEPDEWIRFDGNSGAYLMYCYSRASSILDKGKEKDLSPTMNKDLFSTEEERQLLLKMSKLNVTVDTALESMKPSVLAGYLFDLCQSFNKFYVNVPVLKEENKDLVRNRLALIDGFTRLLSRGLNLLGITPVERM